MSNPTGTTYLQANPNYVWADGDVYEIPQTDTIEAAAAGAAFGGLGVVNQPHQLLLNKINYLKQQSVQASSDIAPAGWYKIEDTDQNLGAIQLIVQWGSITQSGPLPPPTPVFVNGVLITPIIIGTLTVTYSIPFPTAVREIILGAGSQVRREFRSGSSLWRRHECLPGDLAAGPDAGGHRVGGYRLDRILRHFLLVCRWILKHSCGQPHKLRFLNRALRALCARRRLLCSLCARRRFAIV
jgi:hypothetical protein